MCENYIANYKIFQEHQLNFRRFPVFPGAISNSRRFPGVSGVAKVLRPTLVYNRQTYMQTTLHV